MQELKKNNINKIEVSDADTLEYFTMGEEEVWRIEMLQGILEAREEGDLDSSDLEWLDYLCTA